MPHAPVARLILWSLVAALLTGHAQRRPPPIRRRPPGLDAGVPARWQEAGPARQPADDAPWSWWQQFQDPQLRP
jgi:hypothetical protein